MRDLKNAAFKRLLDKRRAITLGAAFVIGLAALGSGSGEWLDRLLQSARDTVRAKDASGEVHIVEIDARSLAEIDRWPWPRGVHAAIIDKLTQAGARTIAFDVDFSATSTPGEDAKLAAALERAGRSVILPTFRQYAGAGSSDFVDSSPAEPFAGKAFLGAVTVVPDADSYVRRMPLGIETLGTPRPSLASMVAERAAQIDRYFKIDYAIRPETIPRHSVIDLIGGKVPQEQLAGKRFFIGATAVEIGDRYGVPNYGVIPGVVIQALAAETLMAGPVPTEVSGLVPLLLTLLLIAFTLRRGSRARRAILFGAGLVALLALPLLTEASFALTVATAPAWFAAIAACLLAGAFYFGARYQQRALTDQATGLPNLTALELAVGSREPLVVVARIDRFAAIAAGLGPAATGMLVQRVAERLGFVTKATIYRTDEGALAWVSGEELEQLDDRFEAVASAMRAPVECGRLVDVTLNMGVAGEVGADVKQLVAHATLAAHHAAQNGSRWERFTDADGDETNWHLSLLGELEAAMACGQVWNAYQPKLDIRSGRIIGAEALVRWLHPERGPIAPDAFIPLVEEHGRARDLTEHVLAQALEDALMWEQAGYPIGVAVNVSATLLADHEFIELVGQRLRGSRVATSRITIEVTESAAMASPERAIAALESWRALGVNISIDDYGTGQSSLGYLQKLPAGELKIDKSFIQAIGHDRRDEIMVRSTIALAHELGIKVVAEGIEDGDCLARLGEMGCDTAQGYHISKPISARAMTQFLSKWMRDAA